MCAHSFVRLRTLPSRLYIEEAAHAAWDAGELQRAFELFFECATSGERGCMINLGYCFDEGVGVAQDKHKAMRWYRRAYRNGDAAAASNVAILYREAGDMRRCYQWFERAARLGDGDSEVELAKLLISGQGVRKSVPAAKDAIERALASKLITQAGCEEAAEILLLLNNPK